MFSGDQVQNILLFPVRDEDARKKFLVASLVTLAGFIIPVLPWLVLYGYVVRMMRQVIDENREPSMPEWTDWNELVIDGLRFLAIRLVITIPLLIVLGFGVLLGLVPVLLAMSDPNSAHGEALTAFVILGNCLWLAVFMLAALISIPLTVIMAAAETHMASKRSLSAAFQVREWWPIFRKSAGWFVLSYLLVMAVSVVGSIVIQVLIFTIVFICLLPFFLMPYSAYILMVLYAFYARAYAQGRAQLPTPA